MTFFRRLIVREPLWIICALWPLALLAPYVQGLPRPFPSGSSWRQEIIITLLLSVTLALLVKRFWNHKTFSLQLHRVEAYWLLPAICFALWNGASVLWAIYPEAALHQAFAWGALLLFFMLVRRGLARPRILRASLIILACAVWTLSIACMMEYWGTISEEAVRTGVQFRYFGGFGEVIAVTIPIFTALALRLKRSRQAALCAATAAVAWLALLQALERAPIIGAGVALITLALLSLVSKQHRPRSIKRVALVLAAFITVTLLQALPSPLTSGRISPFARLQSTSTQEANTRVRFLFWGIGSEMLRARPLTGVGANNYASAYAQARAAFSNAHPDSSLVNMHEEMTAERAHSEYVQIVAELGLVGFVLFALFGVALIRAAWLALKQTGSPLVPGAVCGMLAFALSSGASSFSFRWMGSGLVFFFAAAIVSRFAAPAALSRPLTIRLTPVSLRLATGNAFLLAALMFYSSGTKAMSSVFHGLALRSREAGAAESRFQTALAWSEQEPGTHFNYGMMLYGTGRPSEALPHLRYGVERGLNTSFHYSYLSSAESAAHEWSAAERTLARAVGVYPRSVFLRVRHATALAEAGMMDEARREYARALALDERVARGWWHLINRGFDEAKRASHEDSGIAFAGELYPENCIVPTMSLYKQRAPVAFPEDRKLLQAAADGVRPPREPLQ